MFKGKKKGAHVMGLYKEIKKILPDTSGEKPICAFRFNLDKDDPEKRCDGIFYADKERIRVISDEKTELDLSISQVSEIKTDNGVGCIFVSYVNKEDGEIKLMFRSDMSSSKQIIHVIKKLNHYLEERKEIAAGSENDGADRCEKCGRPFQSGSKACMHCTSKKKVVKRLWNVASPYKGFIISSIVLFFLISLLNLAIPYINKILVDDYITNKNPESVALLPFVLVVLSMLATQLIVRGVSMVRSHLLINASNGMIVDLRKMLFDKIQKLSISKISKRTAGDLMSRVSNDTSQVQNFLVNYLPNVLEQLILFIAVGTVILI